MSKTKAQKKREKFKRQYHSAEYVEWSNLQPCAVCLRWPTVCAHNPTRKSGGTWRDITALCDDHHQEQHAYGVETFQKAHGFRFEQTNAQHCRAWERREATC